jgi:nitrate reductase NapE component
MTHMPSNTSSRGDWVFALGIAVALFPITAVVAFAQNTFILTMLGLGAS